MRRGRFARYAQPFGRRARGDDQRLGSDDVLVGRQRKRSLAEVSVGDVGGQEVCAEARRLFAEFLHQLRPHDAFGKAGIIFDIGSNHQLAARLRAFDDQRIEVRPSAVNRRRQPGRA